MFIHDALLEAVVCGNTEVPARSLHTHITNLLANREGVTNMELEFKVIALVVHIHILLFRCLPACRCGVLVL